MVWIKGWARLKKEALSTEKGSSHRQQLVSTNDEGGTYQPSTTLTVEDRFFVLDFNDQAINRFVEHQMINTFKEFQGGCHMYFKKYRDPDEAHVNPPHILVERDED
uniref:CACTA en-spm transposon protein n=1 Tax=Cucumis melo TaxID=3656 RepID=A0A9I9EHL1_CUCME